MSENRAGHATAVCEPSIKHPRDPAVKPGNVAGTPCSMDKFLQAPFLSPAKTERWTIRGLQNAYTLIQDILYRVTASFHEQLSSPQGAVADAAGPNAANANEALGQLPPSIMDRRVLELYHNLFAVCYSSKKAAEEMAGSDSGARNISTSSVSSGATTSTRSNPKSHPRACASTPSGTDYTSTEQDSAGSGSLLPLSDSSVDSKSLTAAATVPYTFGSHASTDSTTFPSQMSFDSPVPTELESIASSCDHLQLAHIQAPAQFKLSPVALAPTLLIPSIRSSSLGLLSHCGVPGTTFPTLSPDLPNLLLTQPPKTMTQQIQQVQQVQPMQPIQQQAPFMNLSATPHLTQSSTVPAKKSTKPTSRSPSAPLSRISRGGKETTLWTKEEDELLTHAVNMFQGKNWRKIADFVYFNGNNLPRRTADQCNQRWIRTINPRITKGSWPAEEDKKLIIAVKSCPARNWKAISALMPNRTDVQIRGRLQRLAPFLLENHILTADQLPPFT